MNDFVYFVDLHIYILIFLTFSKYCSFLFRAFLETSNFQHLRAQTASIMIFILPDIFTLSINFMLSVAQRWTFEDNEDFMWQILIQKKIP